MIYYSPKFTTVLHDRLVVIINRTSTFPKSIRDYFYLGFNKLFAAWWNFCQVYIQKIVSVRSLMFMVETKSMHDLKNVFIRKNSNFSD